MSISIVPINNSVKNAFALVPSSEDDLVREVTEFLEFFWEGNYHGRKEEDDLTRDETGLIGEAIFAVAVRCESNRDDLLHFQSFPTPNRKRPASGIDLIRVIFGKTELQDRLDLFESKCACEGGYASSYFCLIEADYKSHDDGFDDDSPRNNQAKLNDNLDLIRTKLKEQGEINLASRVNAFAQLYRTRSEQVTLHSCLAYDKAVTKVTAGSITEHLNRVCGLGWTNQQLRILLFHIDGLKVVACRWLSGYWVCNDQ